MNDQELNRQLEQYRTEHGDLQDSISALLAADFVDAMQIARLKKRKLRLKDLIMQIEDALIPDIIA